MGSGYYDQLIKILKKHGCYLYRQGKGSHEIWFSPVINTTFPVAFTINNRHTANGLPHPSDLYGFFTPIFIGIPINGGSIADKSKP